MFHAYLKKVTLDPEVLFTKQERIGKGSFGEVYKGIDNRTSEVITLKICLQFYLSYFVCS